MDHEKKNQDQMIRELVELRQRVAELERAEIERKRMEARIERLTVLKEYLLSALSLDEKLKLITDGVVEIFGADFARIWMVKPGDLCGSGCFHAKVTEDRHLCRDHDRCLNLMASSGRYTHTDGEVHGRVPFGSYKIGRLAAGEDSKFITNDVTHDPRVHDREWARELGLVSFAGYRLLSAVGEPIGVLALFSKRTISPEEGVLLEGLTNTTAQVIQTANVEEEVRQRTAQMEALRKVGLELTSQLDLNALLHSIVSRAIELLGGTSGGLYLYRSELDLLQWAVAIGPRLAPPGSTLRRGEGLSGRVWDTGKARIVDDYEHWKDRAAVYDDYPFKAIVGVPIRWRDDFLGVLNVLAEPPRTFSPADAEQLGLFATQAAVAIENARLYEQAQQEIAERRRAEEIILLMAYHDDLTGLPNRRLFNDRLNQALHHAQRFQEKLGVMLMDLDNFKDVNDTLGHGVGDELLQAVGHRLTDALRMTDTVARMGGDEFVLLLPKINHEEDARNIAQKVLETIREPFLLDGHELCITTSIGFVLYSDDGEDGDTLVKNADIAMYRAKDAGRDNVQGI